LSYKDIRSVTQTTAAKRFTKSTSTAGIASASLALVLFEYRWLKQDVLNWDLFAVGATFVACKLTLMIWYRRND